MANPPCMSDDGKPASFIGTFLATGDTVALCDDCMVPWTAAILNAMTGLDPTPFLVAVSDDLEEFVPAAIDATEDTGGSDTVDPPPPSMNGKRGRTSAVSREAGTATDPNAPPVTISDGQGAAAA